MTFENSEAECLIKRVILETGEVIQEEDIRNIDEVFGPIFFYYPLGLKDRSRAVPRPASAYISQWRDVAKWRQMAPGPAPPHATEQLTKAQVQSILHQYIEHFIEYVADERQRAQPWTRNKSRVEAMLFKLC